ncbi:arginase, partial [Colletotrichum tofieldiae]
LRCVCLVRGHTSSHGPKAEGPGSRILPGAWHAAGRGKGFLIHLDRPPRLPRAPPPPPPPPSSLPLPSPASSFVLLPPPSSSSVPSVLTSSQRQLSAHTRTTTTTTPPRPVSTMHTSMVKSKFLSDPEDLGVVAVGFSGGQCKQGVDAAPKALIESGLLTQLRDELGYKLHGDDEVHLYTDLVPADDPPYRNMKNPRAVSAVTERIADQVYQQSRLGRLTLTLGGDHSIAIGTIAGSAKATRERLGREIAVIWVDAHADINTPETSDSGNVHGMPVAFVTGLAREARPEYFGWLKDEHMLSLKKLVYIGLRDVDAGEKRILRDNGIKAFSMFDIDRYGIGRVMEMALAHIGSDTPIHLSFDVDALDPMWAPSTGTPVRGGLTLREGDYICECVHETGSLVALDLVEVNPSLAADQEGAASETVRAGCSLVRCALGESLL